jgi:hypothetical protein
VKNVSQRAAAKPNFPEVHLSTMDWPFSEENAAAFGGWYEALLGAFFARVASPSNRDPGLLKRYQGSGVAVRLEKGDPKPISLKVASANWELRLKRRVWAPRDS